MKGAGTMNVRIKMILTDDNHTEEGKEIQVEIEESIPGDLQNLYHLWSNMNLNSQSNGYKPVLYELQRDKSGDIIWLGESQHWNHP
jgi:hypothetical protein